MAIRGAGGTAGGIGHFFLGLGLAGLGLYLFLSRVSVTTNMSTLWGGHFGLILLPIALGVALIFFSGRSILGWLLTITSFGLVFLNVVSNLTFFFTPTNLFRTVGMLAIMFIGLVMMARSLRSFAKG